MSDRVTVLLVDDSEPITRGYRKLIEREPDMCCVGTLGSADELEGAVCRYSPDVVLLDLTMPGLDPLDATRALSAVFPSSRVILFSGHDEPETERAAVAAGAWGLVSKLTPPQGVLFAIRRVAAGETVFSTFA